MVLLWNLTEEVKPSVVVCGYIYRPGIIISEIISLIISEITSEVNSGNNLGNKTIIIMIRLNCTLLIELGKNRKPLIDLATELVELSLRDKGCISYDLYGSLTNDDHLMIVETWQSKEDLDAHMASEHFKRIVPQLQELSTMTLEKFSF